MRTRYSEISTFLKCRQLHNYVYRQNLRPKRGAGLPRMDLGTSVHKGFEYVFKQGMDVHAARTAIEKFTYGTLSKVRAELDADPMKAPVDDVQLFLAGYEEIVEKAPLIFERAAEALPISDWEPILVEHTLEQEVAPGIILTGTPDLVARRKSDGGLHLLDWKTRAAFQDIGAERFNLQFLIYTWMLGKAGYAVQGSQIYEIISDVPKAPKINKDGTVSKSKSRTTLSLFDQAIEETGSIVEEYADLRKYVASLEWQRLTPDFRDSGTIERTMRDVVIPAALEMAEERKPLRVANRFACGTCDFNKLCFGELEGDDTAFIRSEGYVNADGSVIQLFTEETV